MYPSYTAPPEPYGHVRVDSSSSAASGNNNGQPQQQAYDTTNAAATSMTQRRTAAALSYTTMTPASPPSYTVPSPTAGYASDTSYAGSTTSNNSNNYGGYNTGYHAAAAPPADTYSSTSAATAATSSRTISKSSSTTKQLAPYPHNGVAALFWVPSLGWILSSFESSTPLTATLCIGLALYAIDLAQFRQSLVFGAWLAVVILTMLCGWFLLVEDEDDDAGNAFIVLFYLVEIAVLCLLFVCGACWITLQVQWLSKSTASSMEQSLHALLPLVASSLGTVLWGQWWARDNGPDAAGILGPYVFALLQFLAMLTLGCAAPRDKAQQKQTKSSTASTIRNGSGTEDHDDKKPAGGKNHPNNNKTQGDFIVSPTIAFGHTFVLLVAPVAMHLATCLGRLLSFYASMDDVYDLVLVATVPYLLQYTLTHLHETHWRPSPYATPRLGHSKTLAGVLRPVSVGLAASWALQQRYLLAAAHEWSYALGDGHTPTWILSLYWTGATLSLLFTLSFWGRVSTATNEPLFGEYHEDVLQLGLSVTGLLVGKGVGLPWNFTPLPVLAFLGLSLWLTTRMLRYLAICLFVWHATGVVVFTYRYAGLEDSVTLPLSFWGSSTGGLELPLFRFALVVVSGSILIGLVAGLSVRSSGGYGNSWIKRFDLAGVVLAVYVLLLAALEIALLKRPVPASELVGVMHDDAADNNNMLYDASWALVTSALLMALAWFMRRVKIVSGRSFGLVVSLAVGKTVAIYVDAVLDEEDAAGGARVFGRVLVTSFLCLCLCAPRFVLQPVHVKTAARYRRSLAAAANGSGGGGNTPVPARASRTALAYVFGLLPAALLVSVPYVLLPLANALKADFFSGGSVYYNVHPPASEVLGFALTLWGVASLAMLHYYLPDGGAEVYKKLAALGFLSGLGLFFAAPTLGSVRDVVSNPFATLSSVGVQVVHRGKSRTGGWGLVAAGIATLLALTGPLELQERKTGQSTQRDPYLLVRTLLFSILFGGGVAWFVIMQSMVDAPWLVLLLTGLSCLAIGFLGTITAVLGYFVQLEDMQEVEQVFTIWLVALPIFLPVTGLPQLLLGNSNVAAEASSSRPHPFGVGGWLSTYLVICSGSALALALALRARARANKDAMTRGLANTGVILSWAMAVCVLYGRYGVAGLDVNYDVTTILGLPASIFGTAVLSLLLLALEGETRKSGTRTQRVTSQSKRHARSSLGVVLENLNSTNLWVPLVAGTAVVFVVASAYAILLRGAGLGVLVWGGDNNKVARSHADVFSNVFGHSKDEHDLATLAQKAVSHVQALATSAQLAKAGFWTAQAGDWMGPALHLAGLVAVLPSLGLLVSQGWKGKANKSLTVLCLPLNAVPLVLSRGIPSLQAAAVLGLVGGLLQLWVDQRAAHASKMRI